MRGLALIVLLFSLIPSALGQDAATPVQRRVTGGDGFITVYGDEIELRRAVLSIAEEVRKSFQQLCGIQGEELDDKGSIVIELHDREPSSDDLPRIAKRLLALPGGYRLQLDVAIERGLDHTALRRNVLSFLVIDRSLRAKGIENGPFAAPEWLVEGLLEAIEWENKRGDRRLYATLLEEDTGLTVTEVLAARDSSELDPISRLEFRAWSGATVMALLSSSDNAVEKFRAYLSDVGSHQGEPEGLLTKHFPDLSLSAKSLRKWVTLKMATLAQAQLTDVLTVVETEERLADILNVRTKSEAAAPVSIPYWDWLRTAEEKEIRPIVARKSEELRRLSYRCFPLYRPIISSYGRLLGTAGDPELAQLAKARKRLVNDALRARDFLDWYEINTRTANANLEEFLQFKRSIKSNEGTTQRTDGISLYLDQVEAILGEGTE